MEFIERNKDVADVNQLSPLVWAYIGDCIYEIFIRTHLVNNSNAKPHRLHIETIKYVKAKAQADTLAKIKECLTEKEKEIVYISPLSSQTLLKRTQSKQIVT